MRVKNHLRSNVIGYVALFVALSGTAYAANTVGSSDIINGEVRSIDIGNDDVRSVDIQDEQVASVDILDNEVTDLDVANNSLRSNEIRNDSLESIDVLDETLGQADLGADSVGSSEIASDSVGSSEVIVDSLTDADLAANSVGSSEIQTDAVQATEVANDSIDSGEIVDFGLSNQDVGVLFAEVNADGTLASSSGGGVTSARVGAVGAGTYEVDFARGVSFCTAVASLGNSTTSVAGGEVSAVDRSANAEAVFVDTNTSAGAAADRAFRLVVVC